MTPVRFLTAALYKFVALPDCAAMKDELQKLCDQEGVKGTLLLATEGINGTISGLPEGVYRVLTHLRTDLRLADLVHKESWAPDLPFLRMKVRVKKEIVTLGVPGVSPTVMAGKYVKPQDWNALIGRPDVVLIDTRNDYEVDIGSFKGAVDPRLKTFADLPAWVAQAEENGGVLTPGSLLAPGSLASGALKSDSSGPPGATASLAESGKKPAVAMFCTGGIRCEKSTAFLKMQGYDEVYHLEGGILKYLEQVPAAESLWQGECFVFDERVSVGHGLKPGPYELCRSCRHPVGEVERASGKYEKGVSCPHCFGAKSEEQKRGFAERQRQVELAQQRGVAHVGAKMPVKPRRLDDPVAHLLALLSDANSASQTSPPRRIVIALTGLPGSGKSTLANRLAREVNVKLGVKSGANVGSAIGNEPGADVALALSMDGFHFSKAQLASFPDPVEAIKRRGAPWTFDAAALKERITQLHSQAEVGWPGFDHGAGDPVAGAIQVGAAIRLVIVEGLYLLYQGEDWRLDGLFQERWYLDTPMETAMSRLLARHLQVNGNTQAVAELRLTQNDRPNTQIVAATRNRAEFRLRS